MANDLKQVDARSRDIDRWLAIGIFIAALLLFLRTLAPDVVDADGGEFQFAAWNFSFVHPTGYPLNLILGGIFQHLVPIGNPAFRLNLFTAITAAAAVSMLYLAAKELTQNRFAAAITAISFALTRTFWYDASAAETYDLNAFFVALLIYLALRWQAEPTAKKFAAFCFASGLALTHHRTIALWLPVFVVFFAIVAWKSKSWFVLRVPSNSVRFAFYALFPLLLYLYIPLRAPSSPYATLPLAPGRDLMLYDNSLLGFINFVLGRVFQNEISWDAVSIARLLALPQLLVDQFTVIGVALGFIGFIAMVWRKREAWNALVLLAGGFIATVLFASVYHIGDIFHYYIPAYLVWAMGIGVGLSALVNFVARRLTSDRRRLFTVYCLLFTVLLVPQFVSNFYSADRSHETQAREEWTRILSAPIPPNAILISNDRDEMMPLWYMQYVENMRRDVIGLFPLITPAPEHQNIGRVTDSVLDTGRPIYFIKSMPGIEVKFNLEATDGLWRVRGHVADESFAVCQPTQTNPVRTFGMTVIPETNALRVIVYWQICRQLKDNYTSFVHVLDANGNKIAQGNDHQVGGEFYPTSLWQVGETLRDEHIINLPSSPSGTYRFRVGMYRSSDLEMLGEPIDEGSVGFK